MGVQQAAAKCQGSQLPIVYMSRTPIAMIGTVNADSQPRCLACVISPTKICMLGEYPAAENPIRNLPISIIHRFWDEATRIQPRRSGRASIIKDTRRPKRLPKNADINPPKIAPRPNIAAETKTRIMRL